MTKGQFVESVNFPTMVDDFDWTGDGARVQVRKAPELPTSALRALGGRRDWPWWKSWVFNPKDEHEVAALFGALRDLRVAFMGGHGWPPAAIFEDLRERKLIAGAYHVIAWSGPGAWEVREA